jgi:hypothetical protein
MFLNKSNLSARALIFNDRFKINLDKHQICEGIW